MLHQEHINQVHIIDRMEGEGLVELKIGDWVKGYHSGYFQVVGFGNLYGFRDDEWYKKGEIISDMVNLKQGFTSKMKFKLNADAVAVQWIKLLSEDIINEINQFWVDNPDKKREFDAYTAPEQLGDLWYAIDIVEESVEQWKEAVDKLPKKINQEQLEGWFAKRILMYRKQYGKSRKKKQQYFISTKVIPESIELGKAPLFEKPQLILGKK